MKIEKRFFCIIFLISLCLGSARGDDFIPYENSISPIYELKDSYITLDITDKNLLNQESYFSTNSCLPININRNLIFLSSQIPFAYCYPTWLVVNFDIPSDWEPGSDMYLDLNWFTLDNSVLGQAAYKSKTTWKLFYKTLGVGDKIPSSFDVSTPSTKDQALNNLVESLKSFNTISFSSSTPTTPHLLVSTAKNLIIKGSNITLNKKVLLIIYREVQIEEDKYYPAINLASAKIIYTKKQLK
jgi:hypothetical protein